MTTRPFRWQLLPHFGALVAFCLVAGRFLRAPVEQVLQIVPDDAFYYLQIARNLVHLGRSTADGFSATNGYHPLWMIVCTGLARVSPTGGSMLRAAVCTSLILHICTALVLRHALAAIVGTRWALTAAACWLVNPLAFLIAQQAVESTTYEIGLLVVFILHMRLSSSSSGSARWPSTSQAVLYGVSLGALCLARTEGVVVVALALLWLAIRAESVRDLLTRGLGRIAIVGTCCLGVVAPWLWFSWRQVGTIVQDSGTMKLLWASDLLSDWPGRRRNLMDTADFFVRRCLRLMTTFDPPTLLLLGLGATTLTVVVLLTVKSPRGPHARGLRTAIVPAIVLGVTYALTLVERQVWWLTLPCLAVFIVTFVTLPTVLDSWRTSQRTQVGAQIVLVVLSIAVFARSQGTVTPPYPWQADVKSSQAAIEAIVPVSERIGSFNAGIPLFFGSSRVVALDGLVNHRAQSFWSKHAFDEFLKEQHIAFIADEQRSMNHALRFMRDKPTFERLASYPLSQWPTKERVLWKISWPEE